MTTHKPLKKSSYNVDKFFPMANQKHPAIFQSTTFSSTYHRQKEKSSIILCSISNSTKFGPAILFYPESLL